MSENVGVSQQKLVSTSASIRDNNATMDKFLGNVVDSVNGLNASWQSEASKNLKAIASNMQTKFALMHNEVETFAEWLDKAAANYKVTESGASETTSKIQNMFK